METEWREWSLEGLNVTQLRFDANAHLQMWSLKRSLLLTFGSLFAIHYADGRILNLDPEKSDTMSPLLALLFRPVTLFRASSEGECQLQFSDGTKVVCLPDERYEAWASSSDSGELARAPLLCTPGGGSPWIKRPAST